MLIAMVSRIHYSLALSALILRGLGQRCVRKRQKPSENISQYECNLQFTSSLIWGIDRPRRRWSTFGEKRLLRYVDTVLIHSLTSIGQSDVELVWIVCLLDPALQIWEARMSVEMNSKLTISIRTLNTSFEWDVAHVFLSMLFEVIVAFLSFILTFPRRVIIFTNNTPIIGILPHWYLTISPLGNLRRSREHQSVLVRVCWCSSLFLFSHLILTFLQLFLRANDAKTHFVNCKSSSII